jgi:tetrahydromethanopterin S-methyltransferase subunit B
MLLVYKNSFFGMDQIQYLIERLDKFEQRSDEKMDQILVQTTKTNGRVNVLEKTVEHHNTKIDTQEDTMNYNKGRERVWWIVIGAAGAVGAMLIQYFINK